MEESQKRLDGTDLLKFGVQAMFILLWYVQVRRFQLISREGYQYSMYKGLYFLCGIGAFLSLYGNLLAEYRMTGRERIVVSLWGLWYTFATVMGNYPSFFPVDGLHSSLDKVLMTILGGFFVGFNLLYWCIRRLPLKQIPVGKRRDRGTRVFLLSFGAMAGVYLLYFFTTAYPGYFTRDSFSAIGQGLSGRYDNTSPFWHTMLVKLCMEIGMADGGWGNSAVWVYGLVQSLMMAAVFAYAVTTLYQAGIPGLWVALVGGLYGLLSYNVIYSVTMWKDVPFSGGALLAVAALYRILKGIGKQTLNDWVFAIGGVILCTMRTNGWYAYLVMAVVMLIVMGRENRRLMTVLAAVLALTWVCNHPLLNAWGVEEGDFVEALAIPFQQVTRVVAEEGEISDEDMALIEEVFYVDRIKELQDPLTVDPMKFEAFRGDRRDYFADHLSAYLGLWLRLGVQNPWLYTKAWVDQTQGYWNAGYHYWISPVDGNNGGGESEEYGISRPGLDNPVSRAFEKLFAFQQSTPPITQPLYGIGFQVWLLLLCFLTAALRKRQEWLLSVPILVIVAGLWVGTPVFAEFRYAYPVFVTVPVLLCVTVFEAEKKVPEKEEE